MREWQKVAFAGSLSGLVFCGVAHLVGIKLLWLAFAIGFAAGYIGYEFRAVLSAIPVAYRVVVACGYSGFLQIQMWMKRSHPFLLLASPFGLGGGYQGFLLASLMPMAGVIKGVFVLVTTLLFIILSYLLALGIVVVIAEVGARRDGEYFFVDPDEGLSSFSANERAWQRSRYAERGFLERKTTYRNVLYWFVGGCFEAFFFVATAWFYLFPIVSFFVRVGGDASLFMIKLLGLIHSSKRMMCGSGGVIGGYVAYALFWHAHMTVPQVAISLMSGVVLGACGALLEWKVAQTFADRKASACA